MKRTFTHAPIMPDKPAKDINAWHRYIHDQLHPLYIDKSKQKQIDKLMEIVK